MDVAITILITIFSILLLIFIAIYVKRRFNVALRGFHGGAEQSRKLKEMPLTECPPNKSADDETQIDNPSGLQDCLIEYYKNLRKTLIDEDASNEGKAIIQIHETSWCPHCIRVMAPWSKIKLDLFENNPDEFSNIVMLEHDEDACRTPGVLKVPLIVKITDKKICRFTGVPDYDTLKKWIEGA